MRCRPLFVCRYRPKGEKWILRKDQRIGKALSFIPIAYFLMTASKSLRLSPRPKCWLSGGGRAALPILSKCSSSDGSNHANESVFLEVEPPTRIVIQHISPPHFILTVTLDAHDGGTKITWVGEFEDPAVADRIRHIVEPANEQNLDRLGSVLSARST